MAREAALGNSFHAVTVAAVLDLWLWMVQARTDPITVITVTKILEGWHQEIGSRKFNDYGLLEVAGMEPQAVSEVE